jgi:hypothetical protein
VTNPGAGNEQDKDKTRSIFSMLIFNGSVSPEIFYNPAEASGSIQASSTYEYDSPAGSVTPAQAIWDPKWRGTPIDAAVGTSAATDPGNNSYAHTPPFGNRRPKWSNTFVSTEAVFGDRGPCFTFTNNTWAYTPNSPFGDQSITLLIHGSRVKWEGNEAFNDNHVEFLTRADPDNVTFSFINLPAGTRTQPDNVFVNENDQTRQIEGTQTASGQPGLGSYTESNANKNTNCYLRPYSNVTGANTSPSLTVWVD